MASILQICFLRLCFFGNIHIENSIVVEVYSFLSNNILCQCYNLLFYVSVTYCAHPRISLSFWTHTNCISIHSCSIYSYIKPVSQNMIKGHTLPVVCSYSPGPIRGVEVIGEKELTVSTQEFSFEWKGYGLRLHFPKGSLPLSMGECTINIKVSFSGQFQLPEDSDLLSPVFWIMAPCKFLNPVTLEIQHCAIQDKETSSDLNFVSTKCSQRDLPYKFRHLEGGVFMRHSSYGSIQLNHFSGVGVTGRDSTPQYYCAHLYHTIHQIDNLRFHFAITQDLEAKNEVGGKNEVEFLHSYYIFIKPIFNCR